MKHRVVLGQQGLNMITFLPINRRCRLRRADYSVAEMTVDVSCISKKNSRISIRTVNTSKSESTKMEKITRKKLHEKMSTGKYRNERRTSVIEFVLEEFKITDMNKKNRVIRHLHACFFNEYFRKWTQAKNSIEKFEEINWDWLNEEFTFPPDIFSKISEKTVEEKEDTERPRKVGRPKKSIECGKSKPELEVAKATKETLEDPVKPKEIMKLGRSKKSLESGKQVTKEKVEDLVKPKETLKLARSKKSFESGEQKPGKTVRPIKKKLVDSTKPHETLKVGRPRKSLEDCSERTLRRKTLVLRNTHPTALLAAAFCSKLREEGNGAAATLIKECMENPASASKILSRWRAPVAARVELPEMDSLDLLKKARLSKRQYILIRQATAPGVLAAYNRVVQLRDSLSCFDMEESAVNGETVTPEAMETVASETKTETNAVAQPTVMTYIIPHSEIMPSNNVDYGNMFFTGNEVLVMKYPQTQMELSSYQIQ